MAKLKWTIEIEVDETWVADGFNPNDGWVQDMMMDRLSWANGSEVGGRIVKAPDQEKVAHLQGYESAAQMNATRARRR